MNDGANSYMLVTDALGRVTKYYFDNTQVRNLVKRVEANCNCGGGSQATDFFYDSKFNLIKTVDGLGRETTRTYDAKGNPLTITTPIGTESFTYNQFSQVLTRTDQMGGVWSNSYDAQGKLITATDPLNAMTTVTYTPQGRIATIKDARNKITSFGYDAQGRLGQITDALSHATTYAYDARSRLVSVTNALGFVTSYEYDAADRIKKVIDPLLKTVEYGYDLAGRRISVTDQKGNVTSYGYDGAYRLVAVTNALNHTSQMSYDLMSNVVSQTDAVGNVTNYQYDIYDRLTKIIYPIADTGVTALEENFEYDQVGNLKRKVDTAGRQTLYDYDTVNRLIRTVDANNQQTLFEYNQRSQMTKVTDAIGQQYLFAYDALGRALSQSRAGGTKSFQYDAVGNVTEKTDYRGSVSNFTYDSLNRLTNISRPAHPDEAVSYTYDALSRVTSGTNRYGTVTNSYDSRNQLISTTDVHGKVVSYNYDEVGRRTKVKLDNVVKTGYVYDQIGRIAQITDQNNQAFSFGYDNANRLTAKVRPNGVSTIYEYDGMSRIKRIKDLNPGTVYFDRQYAYNTANNISQIAEPNKTKNFSYDNLDRLLGVSDGATESYTFNAVGNRLTSHLSNSYTYQPFNRLTQTQQASYTYDANGDLSTKTEAGVTTQFYFDYDDKLRYAVKSNGDYELVEYDAFGRVTKNVTGTGGQNPTNTTVEIANDGDNFLQQRVSNGYISDYVNGLGLDNYLSYAVNGFNIYPLTDHLGSVNGITESTGYLMQQTDYDSFGNPTNPSFQSNMTFAGMHRDPFSGFYYARARLYDPQIGRFISEDPIGLNGGINQFGYVEGNPINFNDPTGLDKGWGSQLADWADEKVNVAQDFYGGDPIIGGVTNLVYNEGIRVQPIRLFDIVRGFNYMFRVGEGTYCAFAAEDENMWGRAAFVTMDIGRGANLFSMMAGPFAGRVGGTLTGVERRTLQKIANKYDTDIFVVGSRGRGAGRNVGTNKPFGKGRGTRSDIDIRVNPDIDPQTGGRFSHEIYDNVPGSDVRSLHTPVPPWKHIKISPKKK